MKCLLQQSIFGIIVFILNCFSFNNVNAQQWIVGDTIGYSRIVVEQTFEPSAEVSFDIDCDGIADLLIFSTKGSVGSSPDVWSTLHFRMEEDVEVLHDIGFISTYDLGESLPFVDSWFEFYMGNRRCWWIWATIYRE